MRNREKSQLIGIAAGLAIVSVGVLKESVKTIRTERKKRKELEEWRNSFTACATEARDRMAQLYEDPTKTWSEVQRAYYEEMAFIEIVWKNRPQ